MDDTPRRVEERDPPLDDLDRLDGTDDVTGRTSESIRGSAEAVEDPPTRRRTTELRREIEETREEMTGTIDAIQEKLRPRNIVANATERVKEATTERVRGMMDTASETADSAMSQTREYAGDAADYVRQNPIPAVMIGLGAVWLLTRNSTHDNRSDDRDAYRSEWGDWSSRGGARSTLIERVRDNPVAAALAGVGVSWLAFGGQKRNDYWMSRGRQYGGSTRPNAWGERDTTGTSSNESVTDRAREYASETTDSVRRTTYRARNQFQQMLEDNPLLVGAGALMLGAAFGLAVPESELENEWMGDARDSVVDKAQDMVRGTAEKVQGTANQVADAASRITGNNIQS